MTDGLRPYPEYRDSGFPWLGTVPSHWGVRASKRMFTESGERAWPDDQQLSATQSHGVIPQAEYERLVGRKVVRIINHLDKRKHVEKDDFVISMRSFQGGLERAWSRGAIRSSYVVLKPKEGIHVPYFAHLFKSQAYIQALRTTSEFIRDGQDLTFSNFCDVPLPVVPLDEQRAIASYLDANAVKVNRFIRNRRRLIEVLTEQKQAIINRAVTRGLNPNAPLKPSGIDWLGDVPKHWEVKRLKWVTRLQRGYDLPQQRRTAGRYPVVSSGGIIDTHDDFRAQGPGVVMGRYGSTDAIFYLEQDFWPHNTSLFVTDFQGNNRRWCYYLLRTISKADLAGKSAVPGIDRKDLYDICVVQPPQGEQEAIVLVIEEQSKVFDDMIGRTNREIELIREYRTRLIADVVTGKLDVRHLAPADAAPADEATLPDDADDDGEIEEDEPELVEESAED